jgi:hypothetical protein
MNTDRLGQLLLAAGFWLASAITWGAVALGAVVLAYAACWAIGQLLLAAARVR